MAEQQERDEKSIEQKNREWTEQTRAAGNRDGLPEGEAEDTPPGGDVRTAYMGDREPGEPEPQQPSQQHKS